MRIHCPHCHNPIDVEIADLLTDISCTSCGSNFNLVSAETPAYTPGAVRMIAHFELLESVGAGRFGTVWKAHDTKLDRIVAVKIPRHGETTTGPEREMFVREARSAAQVKHPGVVSVHEVGREADTLYIVSDFIEGCNLNDWPTGRMLPPREAAELCAKVADALDAAHEAGVVHRDLKPSNVMMDLAGEPHLTDFGLAKRETGELTMTIDGQVLGTPAYMSPEQARGEAHQADRRSDVYSLGVILFKLLTGELPFRGAERMMIVQILRDEPPSPRKLQSRIPRDLETICLKCLHKEPSRRYGTARALAEDLRRFLAGNPIKARPISTVARTWRWCLRNRAVALLLSAVFLILLTGMTVSGYFAYQANRSALRADTQAQAAIAALYESTFREARMTRVARIEGYREVELELTAKARKLDTPSINIDDLRREVVAAMGDFVGYRPVLITGFPAKVTAIALGPDAKALAIGFGDGTTWVCDPSSGKKQRELAGNRAAVFALAFSLDGTRLVSAAKDGSTQTWDLESAGWRCSGSFQVGDKAQVLGISAGGELLAMGSGQTAEVWDVSLGQRACSLAMEKGWSLRSAAFNRERTQVAGVYGISASAGKGLAIWDASSGRRLWNKDHDLGESYPNGIAFSQDSTRLAVGFDEALLTYEIDGLRQRSFKRLGVTKALAFSPDDRYLAAVDVRGRLTIWNSATDRELAMLANYRNSVSREAVAFSADGAFIASSNADTVRVWRLDAAKERRVFRGHDGGISCLAFNPEKSLLASGGKDRTIRLWDPASGKSLSTIKTAGPVQSLAFSANGRLLAIGFWGGKNHGIEVRDARTFDVLLSEDHDLGDIYRLALFDRGDQQYLAGCGDSGFSIWSLENSGNKPGGLTLKAKMHQKANRCLSLAVSPGPDPRWVAWVREERKIALWDIQNSRAGNLSAPPMNQGWHGLAFFPDGQRLAFVSNTAAAEIWDVASDKHLFQLGDENQFHAPHIALSKDGTKFAGLLQPDVVSIWNTSDRKLLYSFRPEQSEVWSLAWSPEGDRLAVGLSDGGLVVWDLPTIEAELARIGLESPQR